VTHKWFEGPPIAVIDWARPGTRIEIRSLEAAAVELLKWPKSKKRDEAARLINKAFIDEVPIAKAEKAFLEAAKHAKALLSRNW
jgi:hypothetical protein